VNTAFGPGFFVISKNVSGNYYNLVSLGSKVFIEKKPREKKKNNKKGENQGPNCSLPPHILHNPFTPNLFYTSLSLKLKKKKRERRWHSCEKGKLRRAYLSFYH